uniref:DUF616 domain-containing protein n=1 Tax=viral metagenome TaxID=1070528 RepID=A0A6C0JQS2_9ZZZZ
MKKLLIFILLLIICIISLCNSLKYKEGLENIYNIAFYTCFYGTDDNPAFAIPEIPSDKYDCYYFSNNKKMLEKLNGTKWIGIYDNKLITNNPIESCMHGKHVKVVPEDFEVLKHYDYTCFLDSKLDKVSETFVENFIETHFIKQNYALLLREHLFIKDNVWNEYNESMKQDRYVQEKEKYKKYINNQISTGLIETTDKHCQCGFLIRNMRHPNITEIDKTWYSHIQECGIQDQISFFFVKQLFNGSIYPFKETPFVEK